MTFTAFGITGDLMRLKILPALYGLYTKGTLPRDMRIVGVSRKPWSDAELRAYIKEVLPQADEVFLSCFTFVQGEAEDVHTFSTLMSVCGDDDVLMYLAISPALYGAAFNAMQRAGFGSRVAATHMMIEKPFGRNGAEAEDLYAQLKSLVAEHNIFFVDHYCAKDWVRELRTLSIPREQISRIHIRLFETIGVEKRGVSYDKFGALRDVGQNHMLQMVASLLSPDALEQLPVYSAQDVAEKTIRAQYEGYRDITGVAPESKTETYFTINTHIGKIELVLEGGKAQPSSRKEVEIEGADGTSLTMAEFSNKEPEYEVLIAAALQGDHSLFPSIHDVRAQWRFVDPIVETWATGIPPLGQYRH